MICYAFVAQPSLGIIILDVSGFLKFMTLVLFSYVALNPTGDYVFPTIVTLKALFWLDKTLMLPSSTAGIATTLLRIVL